MSKILVVEDTPDCMRALTRLLQFQGHTVECAGDGRQALDVLDYFTPDLIILDVMMPVMDGVSFLEAMRAKPSWKAIRVIVFSGCAEGVDAQRLADLGVWEVVTKGSFDVDRLLALVA